MKNKKRAISLLLALILTLGLLPMTAFAAEAKTYLALGDSITAGVALENPQSEAFPVLLVKELGETYTLVNMAAQTGETTETLLEKLDTEDYQTAVAQADVITITIGGNDLMALFYEFLADGMNMTVDEVKATLADGTDLEVLTAAANVINSEENGFDITEAQIAAILENHQAVIAAVRALNASAILVVSTQYNPYKYLTGQVNDYYSLLPMFAPDYVPLADAVIKVNDVIENSLSSFNAAIKAGSGYSVADVYTDFDNSSAQLCNAVLVMSGTSVESVNMDFHPNAAGHEIIAQCMAEAIAAAHTHSGGNATCKDKALCEVCGEAYGDLADHTWNDGVVTTEATCTEDGVKTFTCSVCGATQTEVIPATGSHTWDEGVVTTEPSEAAPGVRTYTCTVCGETTTEEIPYVPAEVTVQRIAGSTRVETAIEAANVMKAEMGVEKFSNIIVASGLNFADALAGSYLAVKKEAPILLYLDGNTANLTYIQENLAEDGTIYVLGGNAAVKETFDTSLTDAGIAADRIVRLAGATRFETNLLILEEAGVPAGEEILVATGLNFADCLSASAVGKPILMVNSTNNVLTDAQKSFLSSHADSQVAIIGGTSAVSETLEAAVAELVEPEIIRLAGSGREDTSVKVAERYFTEPTFAVVAYSLNYPDGLCGGPLAFLKGAPLLLTRAGQEAVVADYIEANAIDGGCIIGGTSVLSDDTVQAVFGISNGEDDGPGTGLNQTPWG